jgi:hypothetical protein
MGKDTEHAIDLYPNRKGVYQPYRPNRVLQVGLLLALLGAAVITWAPISDTKPNAAAREKTEYDEFSKPVELLTGYRWWKCYLGFGCAQ